MSARIVADLAASVARHQGTSATLRLRPWLEDDAPDAPPEECRGCEAHRRDKHALADQDAHARRELIWSQIDLQEALDRNRARDAAIERLSAALDALTHGFEPGVVIRNACGECGRGRDAAEHRTAEIVLKSVAVTPHVFAPGIGAFCVFPTGGQPCGHAWDSDRHKVEGVS